jgi:type IX secretion system PorP/SprF family membrane protein
MKNILLIFIIAGISLSSLAQQSLSMSQYMHNQYAINPAFAGSREVITAYLGYRKQWAGMPSSPNSQFFSAHAPLKNESLAVGLTFFNEEITIAKNTGFSLAYAYRINLEGRKRLAFSINGGAISSTSSWDNVRLINPEDNAFGAKESELSPLLGFGMAWYSNTFFTGFSVPDLFYKNSFDEDSPFFNPAQTNFIITGGYLYRFSPLLAMQPSALIRINPNKSSVADISSSIIIQEFIWVGATYRTNSEIIAHVGWQVSPQYRLSYSYDYPTGDLGFLNNGSHEISLQFDFGYTINSVSPKFF